VAHNNVSTELLAFMEGNPIAPGRHSVTARAALDRRTVHVQDVRADAEYSYTIEQVDPYRTAMAIPMLRGDELASPKDMPPSAPSASKGAGTTAPSAP